MSRDPVRVAIHVGVYIVLAYLALTVFGGVLAWTGYLIGAVGATVLAAILANWLSLRIFENLRLADAGLWWTKASPPNLGIGIAGGAAAAAIVLVPPLVLRASRLAWSPIDRPSVGSIVFVLVILAVGVVGEELLFRGYAFQKLIGTLGAYATILPFGALFALMHAGNPNVSFLGLFNTAMFGVLFGYAYLRSRDLWLPIGLHLGWNVTLPLFGVHLSGLRMNVTGYEMSWTAGALWSGGEYGPEASVLTSVVVVLLFVYLWKAPIRRQFSPISGPPAENAVCEPSPSLPS